MQNRKRMLSGILLGAMLLPGCNAEALNGYRDELELRVYGNGNLEEIEIDCLDQLMSQYADSLFCIDGNDVDQAQLRAIAPNEDADEWNQTYTRNQTYSELETYQLMDIYVETPEYVQCLCLCEAVYQDWRIPEDSYWFIVQVDAVKEIGGWKVQDSALKGTARVRDTAVVRDDVTGVIKFIERGEMK